MITIIEKCRRTATTSIAVATLSFVSVAEAGPISAAELPDNFGGPVTCLGNGNDVVDLTANAADCAAAGGFVMTPFGDDPHAPGTLVSSVVSPIGGIVNFLEQDGTNTVTDSLQMIVGDPSTTVGDPDWWQYDDHSSVYMTHVNWIELHFDMPAVNPVRAFSFFVGADFNGAGWIQGFDEFGNESLESFSVSGGNSPGFSVIGDPASCTTISRIIVEPNHIWGVGNFAINQDPCTTVPEPGSLPLFALGLIGFAYARRARRVRA